MPSDAPSADLGVSRDERLRIASRVDWRFLLGSPVLGDVVLAGSAKPDLREALDACARSVRTIDGSPEPSDGATVLADVAVIAGEVPEGTLRACVAALRPGGWLVAETSGLLAWRPGRRMRGTFGTAASLARRLERLDLDPVTVYLAWPDHRSTLAYVPLDDGVALPAWVARRVDDRVWRVAARAAAAVARTAVPAVVGPALTVIAQHRVATGTATPGPAGWLGARVDAALMGVADPASTPSILMLTPRFRASGHVVGLADLSVSPAGGPRAVVKAARLPQDHDSIEREAEAIRRLETSLGSRGLAPVLLASGSGDAAAPYLVESGVHGSPLDPRAVRRDRDRAARGIAAFVVRLPVSDDSGRPFARIVRPAMETLRERSAGLGIDDLVADAERVTAPAADAQVPSVVEHGDLAHPNLVVTADGSIGAVDWERSRARGLPLHDLVIGLAYVAAADRGAKAPAAQAAAFQASLAGRDAWLAHLIEAELARLGIDPLLRSAFLLAPWLRTAAWLAERTEPARWLADRSVAHWRAMLGRPAARSR